MFYLNRSGAPEGPFEEGAILAMIGRGELVYGNICWVGHNQWAPLEAHPPFARALAEHRARAHAFGPAAAGPANAYAAPAPAYAPGMVAGAGQAPAPHVSGAHPSRLQSNARGQGRRILLILALIGMAGVFLLGSALGAYLLFFGGSAPRLSASVPRDVELFLEIPNVKKSLSDLGDVQFLESSSRDEAKLIQDAVSAVVRAFEISQADAEALLLAAESAGIAARKLATTPEGLLILGFRRAGPVEALLRSPRFTAAGPFGAGGRKYFLARKALSERSTDLTLQGLSGLEVTARGDVLVWFPEQNVLLFGAESVASDAGNVMASKVPALAENPSFASASKDFPSDGRLLGFLDPGVWSTVTDRALGELIEAYFKPAGPMTAVVRVKKPGLVTSVTGRFIGSRLPKASLHEPAIQLSLPQRLPAETFACAAFSTKSRLTASDVEKILLDHLGAADPGSRAELERGLRELEQVLGVSTQKLYESLGNQAVLAALAPADVSVEQAGGGEALARFALVYVQELKDESAPKALLQELKSKLLPAVADVNVADDPSGGFLLTPKAPPLPVSLRARFVERHLFVSAGANVLNDRAEAAFFRGDRTLKEDAAYRSAISVLPPTAHFSLWIDSGRIADTVLKSPFARAIVDASGLQVSRFKLAGPERVTSALSFGAEVENETWIHRVDAVNLQAVAPLAAGALLFGGARGVAPAAPGFPLGAP